MEQDTLIAGNEPSDDLSSTLTCPVCGTAAIANIPPDRCLYFYECRSCHTVLKPKPGDCCVFCSYGSKRCPFVADRD
ncbi:MAG: GDCCVxC domain-containing (seleno)protein [Vicinamibacterales bacterium]